MKIVICLLAVVFGISCNQKKGNSSILNIITVDMSDTVEKSFDEWVEDINCIPLQNTTESFDDCWKLIAYKGYFYLYSFFDFSVTIYDHDGLFLKKIDNRGKGKVLFPTDILINKEKDELWICESRSIIQKYSLIGEFINSMQLSLPNIKMEFVDKNEILVYADLFDRNSDRLFYLLQGDTYAVIDSFIDKNRNKQLWGRISPSLFATDKSYNVSYALLEKRNVICKYEIGTKTLLPYIRLDFKGKYFTEDMYPDRGFTDQEKAEFLKKNEYIRDIVGLQAISGNIFFYTLGNTQYYYSIDTKTNTVCKYSSLFDGFSPRNINSPICGSDAEYLYLVVDKQEILNYYNKGNCKYKKAFDYVFSENNRMNWENAVVCIKMKR